MSMISTFTLANDKTHTVNKTRGRKPYTHAVVSIDANEVISCHTDYYKALDAQRMKCLARYACATIIVKADR